MAGNGSREAVQDAAHFEDVGFVRRPIPNIQLRKISERKPKKRLLYCLEILGCAFLTQKYQIELNYF